MNVQLPGARRPRLLIGFASMSPARCLLALALAAAAGCGQHSPGGMSGPSMNNKLNAPPPVSSVVSVDILDREARANHTRVKHILIGWKDLAEAYGGHVDPRAAARTKQDAEAQVRSILAQLDGGADFDVLMKQFSEDRGSASNPDGYDVSPDAQLVLDFRRLGLRLDVGEVGVVESEFGFHIMKRLE